MRFPTALWSPIPFLRTSERGDVMKYVWIALGVLLGFLILKLLFGKTKLRIAASATQVKVLLTVCGIRIWILPTRKGILKKGKDSKIVRKMQQSSQRRKEEKRIKHANFFGTL